jgi:hypothetical protein
MGPPTPPPDGSPPGVGDLWEPALPRLAWSDASRGGGHGQTARDPAPLRNVGVPSEPPAQEEAATEIDEIIVTGQRDYLYRADQSDALGTSIPLAELPATVNVITEDFLEDTRAYDIEDV